MDFLWSLLTTKIKQIKTKKSKQSRKKRFQVCRRGVAGERLPSRVSGCFSCRPLSFHCPLSLWAKMTGSRCWGKPKGFILRLSVRKGLWNKFSHSAAFLKVKQRDMICRIWGKPLKTKLGKRKNKPFLRDHSLFVFAAWQGKMWESSGRKGLKGDKEPVPLHSGCWHRY